MKTNSLILLFAVLFLNACSCVQCENGNCENTSVPVIMAKKEPTIIVKETAYKASDTRTIVDNKIKYYISEQNPSCISESASIKAPLVDKTVKVDDREYEAFVSKVSMTDSTNNAAGYQYRDIRVDEIMPLAARYCREHGDRTAILRKINLYHGYYRRISFDCVSL